MQIVAHCSPPKFHQATVGICCCKDFCSPWGMASPSVAESALETAALGGWSGVSGSYEVWEVVLTKLVQFFFLVLKLDLQL